MMVCQKTYVNVIYVNAGNRSPVQNGKSWKTAYLDLQPALDDAALYQGSQIWIAQGVYTPSKLYSPNGVPGGLSGLTDVGLRTFNIPDSTSLFGGFRGCERKLRHRCVEEYETILSGANTFWHTVVVGNDLPNTVGVIAALDGITLIDGNANGPSDNPLGTLFAPLGYAHNNGGALYIINDSSVAVRNCLFRNNRADNIGGAVYTNNCNVSFCDCLFRCNYAANQAGAAAFYNTFENPAVPHSAYVYSCVFEENSALNFGGAIVVEGTQPNPASKAVVKNSLFFKNSAYEGGAIVVDSETAVVECCRFLKNLAYINGGAIATTNIVSALNAAASRVPIVPANYTTTVDDCFFCENLCEANAQLRAVILGGPTLGISFPIGGGAITTYLNGLLNVNNSKFYANVSYGDAGAILNGKSSASNPTFVAANALEVYAARTTVNNSEFIDNVARGSGGAIASEKDDVVFAPPIVFDPAKIQLNVFSSLFKKNVAYVRGGAIYLNTSTALLIDNCFKCNKALVEGNNVYQTNSIVTFAEEHDA